ncbi:MAG: hypothetical protein M0002_08095 [Rhodospirillales bacterium]|nr:hypothetical protein [Rhodospirillales bacterium]
MTDIRIKRGTALQLTMVFANADGSAFDLTQVALSGDVRDSRDNLVGELTFTLGAPGVATVTVADTSTWPLGLLRADVAIVSAGWQTLSETIPIYVDRPVTWALPDPAAPNPVLGT